MSQQLNEIDLTWTIENYSFCDVKRGDYFCCPAMKTNFLSGTEWKFRIYPRGYRDSKVDFICLYLERRYSECIGNNSIIDLRIEICSSKNEIFSAVERKRVEFSKLTYQFTDLISTRELQNKMKNSSEENLVVQCRIRAEKSTKAIKKVYSTKTRVSLDVLSFLWSVNLDIRLKSFPRKTVQINDKTNICINVRAPDDDILIEIKSVSRTEFSLHTVKCEIVCWNREGIETISFSDLFTFEREIEVWKFPPFFKKSLLKAHGIYSEYPTLKFNISIPNGEFFDRGIDETSSSSVSFSKKVSAVDKLTNDLRAMLLNEEHIDVTFQVDSEIVKAHRQILASRSPVFSAMFKQNMSENETGVIDVADMDVHTLRLLLEFLYTGEIEDLDCEVALDLLLAAEKYQVASLKDGCLKFLENNLTADNVCDVVSVADMLRDSFLKTAAIDYIKEHSTDILGTPKWLKWIKKNGELCSEIFYSFSQDYKSHLKK